MSAKAGVEKRVRSLMDDHETLLDVLKVNDTDRGAYYLVVRYWPHPSVDGAHILSERTAYLTFGAGSDGWVTETEAAGINRRVPQGVDPAEFARKVGQAYLRASAGISAAPDHDVHHDDLGGD